MRKRVWAWVITLVMVVALLPTNVAFAKQMDLPVLGTITQNGLSCKVDFFAEDGKTPITAASPDEKIIARLICSGVPENIGEFNTRLYNPNFPETASEEDYRFTVNDDAVDNKKSIVYIHDYSFTMPNNSSLVGFNAWTPYFTFTRQYTLPAITGECLNGYGAYTVKYFGVDANRVFPVIAAEEGAKIIAKVSFSNMNNETITPLRESGTYAASLSSTQVDINLKIT